MGETLQSIIQREIANKIREWATTFHAEMEKAKSIAANDDIRVGLTHGQIIWGKVFERE